MYESCNLIMHGLCFYSGEIVSCCYASNDKINGGYPPILFPNYRGEIIHKDVLFSRIKQYSSLFKQGRCPKECKGCFQIKKEDWDEGEYINSVTITNFSICNANCIYCSNNCRVEERRNNHYEVFPFLKYLKNEGVLKQNCEIHIGGGEFTIYKDCDAILDEFGKSGFSKMFVPTNAIRYSESLNEAIKKGNTYAIISLDSGSRETYQKIKRTDAFNKVVENICKYAKDTPDIYRMTLKYVIIPGVNDNIGEFKKFLKIAKKAGIMQISIDMEARYLRSINNNINPFYLKMASEFKNIAEKYGFKPAFHSFILQSKPNKTKFKDFIDFIQLKYLKSGIKKFYTYEKYTQ